MDSTSLTVVIAIACLAIGALVSWLLMRGRVQTLASPPSASQQTPANPGLQAELGKAKAQALALEAERKAAIANYEKSSQQAAQLAQALELAKQEQAKAVEKAAQVPGLELRLRALQEQEKANQPNAQAKSKIQNELADAKKRQRVLEDERQSALASCEKVNLQAKQLREALELAQKEQARLAGQAAQVPALEARLLAMHDQENADHAAAAQAKLAVQAELDLATERGRQTEQAYQETVSSHQELKLQAAQWRQALDQAQNDQAQLSEQAAQLPALQAQLAALQQENQQQLAGQHALQEQLAASSAEQAEALKRAAGRLAEVQAENASLKENAATVAALLAEHKEAPAIAPAPAEASTSPTQLPALETEVVALQSLAKTIQQEFQLFAEMQRNFTLTSTTVHDFSDDETVAEETASVAT